MYLHLFIAWSFHHIFYPIIIDSIILWYVSAHWSFFCASHLAQNVFIHFAKSKHMLLKSKKILLKFCWQFLTKQSSGLDFILDYGIAVCMSSCQLFRSVFCFMWCTRVPYNMPGRPPKESALEVWVTQCTNKWWQSKYKLSKASRKSGICWFNREAGMLISRYNRIIQVIKYVFLIIKYH